MLDLLAAIRDRARTENHWQGAGPLEAARARFAALAPGASAEARWSGLLEVAEHELRMGETGAAVEHFLEAKELLGELPASVSAERRLESIFRLGVAALRLGESRNCRLRPSPENCILPIRGRGVHVEQEGSRLAIASFDEVLARADSTSPRAVEAVWLLNLAQMTIGGYPDRVPADRRIPPPVFDSGEPFPRFENRAPELGVDTVSLSGGAVADDLDGDGWIDLFTTTYDIAGEPRFFRNRGGGSFDDVSVRAGLTGLYGGLHLVHADYDGDGDVDLYVLRGAWLGEAGRHPNSLLRNEGGVFADVTFSAGLGGAHYPTQTAAWADYDNDGDLDLFVGNEHGGSGVDVYAGLSSGLDAPCQLFRNRGDGTFEEVAASAGVAVRAYVKGVAWGDVDEDRFPDLYLSVLGGPNRLFRNRGDGTFEDVTAAAGVAEPIQSFPIWFWDFDQDGHLDLYVSSYRGSPGGMALVAASAFGAEVPWELARLYRGDGRGGFTDVSRRVGLERLHLPMGSSFGDADGDGWLDFYLGTGYPDYEALMPNVLYRNVSGRRFVDVTWAAGVGHLQKGHAVAFADLDGDGDLDLFEQMGGAFPGDAAADVLYENPGAGNRWITIELRGTTSNRSAIGARIRVDLLEHGRPRRLYRHVGTGSSFGGNPLRQTIGIGRAGRVERLEVYWPTSDLVQTFDQLEPGRRYVIEEGRPDPIAVLRR